MNRKRDLLAFLLALVLLLSLAWGLGWVMTPARTCYGALWDRYRLEEPDSLDVLFFGSSIVYCDVVPGVLWEESGLRSFVMAGPEQTMPFSYYAVREACRTQSPRLIAVELRGMFFEEYESYTMANLTYMPLTPNRLAATFAGGEPEEWLGALYPLYNYHSRWSELTGEMWDARLHPTPDPAAGFTPAYGRYRSGESFVDNDLTAESDTYRKNLRYLEKLRDFCGKRDIALYLFIAPSCSRIPAAVMTTLNRDAEALGLTIHDLNGDPVCQDIPTDTDCYDYLHFNPNGAEKFSRHLAGLLLETGAVTPTPGWEEVWQERAEYAKGLRYE